MQQGISRTLFTLDRKFGIINKSGVGGRAGIGSIDQSINIPLALKMRISMLLCDYSSPSCETFTISLYPVN